MDDLELNFSQLVEEIDTGLTKQGMRFQFHEYGDTPGRNYSFTAPKTFAWVHKKPRLDCLAIGTRKEWADRAGIEDYEYRPHSQFNGPGAHWRILEGDSTARQKVVSYLIRICKTRHFDT